uniref:Uncharacterized protein n=1 Tax=Oryza meridionalis TaxID=40149 RepID=A0A0E0EFE5_9ORYZ
MRGVRKRRAGLSWARSAPPPTAAAAAAAMRRGSFGGRRQGDEQASSSASALTAHQFFCSVHKSKESSVHGCGLNKFVSPAGHQCLQVALNGVLPLLLFIIYLQKWISLFKFAIGVQKCRYKLHCRRNSDDLEVL